MSGVHCMELYWDAGRARLAPLRRAVFIEEQGVPEALEWDEHDAGAVHFLALADGRPVGCARLLPDGHLGRMAVLAPWRGRGVGRCLMAAALAAASRRGYDAIQLSAQVHAIGFYARFGFSVASAEYDEAGIPHVAMRRTLTASGAGSLSGT